MKRVAILRPEPGNRTTLDRARAMGLDAFAMPLFTTEAMDWEVPLANFDGLLLTSANAVRLAGPKLALFAMLPVHAVGKATATEARAAGLGVVTVGDGGVDALLNGLEPKLRLLHLCGEDRVLPQSSHGPTLFDVPVYRSRAIDEVAGLDRLQEAIAMIHSPRAAARLAEIVDRSALDRSSIGVAAISHSAANAAGKGWARVSAAKRPSDDALLALTAELCKMTHRS